MLIKRIFKKIFLSFYSYFNHIGYAKYIGVKIGKDVHIYMVILQECLVQNLGVSHWEIMSI